MMVTTPLYLLHQQLFSGCEYGNVKLVEECLNHEDININMETNLPLRLAAKNGHFDIVQLLLDRGAKIQTGDYDVGFEDAARNGHSKIVKLMLERRADVHGRYEQPLFAASVHGHLEVVELLLNGRANPQARNSHALHMAVEHEHLHIVDLLLERGADIHSDKDYALRTAVNNGSFKIVRFLLRHGANVHAENDYALRWAASLKFLKIVQFLLKNGACLPIVNCKEEYLPTSKDQNALLKTLLKTKHSKEHVFFFACSNNYKTIVSKLINTCCDNVLQ